MIRLFTALEWRTIVLEQVIKTQQTVSARLYNCTVPCALLSHAKHMRNIAMPMAEAQIDIDKKIEAQRIARSIWRIIFE